VSYHTKYKYNYVSSSIKQKLGSYALISSIEPEGTISCICELIHFREYRLGTECKIEKFNLH
jgi:hypothetical protein